MALFDAVCRNTSLGNFRCFFSSSLLRRAIPILLTTLLAAGLAACDESAKGVIERLNEMFDDVTAGRFREAIEVSPVSFMGSGWVETKFWSPD